MRGSYLYGRSAQRYAAELIAGARPPLTTAGRQRELLDLTDEMTGVLRDGEPRDGIAVAQGVFARAFELAAILKEGLADDPDGGRVETVIQGWVRTLGEALREFVGANYPYAEGLYGRYGAVPAEPGVAVMFGSPPRRFER